MCVPTLKKKYVMKMLPPLPQVVGGSGTVGRVSSLDDALQRRVEDARSRGKVLR